MVVVQRPICLLLVLSLAACSRKPKHPDIVVTVPAWQSLVCVVAGPDAHVHAATDASLPAARLVFRNGLGLPEPTPALAKDGKQITLGDRVPTLPRADGTPDPYVWTTPQNARLAVQVVGEELARADAARAKEYRTRAKELDARLAKLDAELDAAPKIKGPMVPAEARYFGERFAYAVDASKSVGELIRGSSSCEEGYMNLVRGLMPR